MNILDGPHTLNHVLAPRTIDIDPLFCLRSKICNCVPRDSTCQLQSVGHTQKMDQTFHTVSSHSFGLNCDVTLLGDNQCSASTPVYGSETNSGLGSAAARLSVVAGAGLHDLSKLARLDQGSWAILPWPYLIVGLEHASLTG